MKKVSITINIERREIQEGIYSGVRVWSDDLPGLVLSHQNTGMVVEDIGRALPVLLKYHLMGLGFSAWDN